MDQNLDSTNPATPTPTSPVSDTQASSDVFSGSPAPTPDPVPVSDPDPTPVSPATPPDTAPVSDSVVMPDQETIVQDPDITVEVTKKISESHNVLVALSGDPSVDEMAAAIGLTLFLDKLGKRATAIYSGATPNALEFLKPEETFEPSADTLQDFVVAISKDKADHLRYKLDGDYVKIFITPYKTRIDEEDLEFSYGDFNVDLVIALDVTNGIDLDAALREHGRIMHDAVIINVTTGNPGKFGEIEWSDKSASSISEMIAKLLYDASGKIEIGKEEATAFLTGIVAATNRFSNARTTSETMQISSRLMQSGANQQLISKNITPDVDNELYSLLGESVPKHDTDPTSLEIKHDAVSDEGETKEEPSTESSALLDDLKAAEASLSKAGSETVPDVSNQPIKLDNPASISDLSDELKSSTNPTGEESTEAAPADSSNSESPEPSLPPVSFNETLLESDSVPGVNQEGIINTDQPEKVIQPTSDIAGVPEEGTEKYGKMLEDALSGLGETASAPTTPIVSDNPASAMAPEVPATPEINGVPEINYMPMPGEEVLPPPPTPPIDMDAAVEPTPQPIEPAAPPVQSEPAPTPLGSQPAMQDQVYAPQVSDPSAFKIPGM